MLTIASLSKLKITKVKPWMLFFTYDEQRYFVHGTSDCGESVVTLYEREINEHGHQTFNALGSHYIAEHFSKDVIRHFGKPGMTYAEIDKVHFVSMMVKLGFLTTTVPVCQGKYISEHNAEINKAITSHKKKIAELKKLLL